MHEDASRREAGGCGHLVTVDCRVNVVPVLHPDNAEDVVDAQPLQPVDGKRGGQSGQQHVVLGKRLEDVRRHAALALPVSGMLVKVLVEEGAAGLLPS